MTTRKVIKSVAVLLAVALASGPVVAQTHGDAGEISPERLADTGKPRPYSPYADRKFPERPLFGDTHLHTAFSMDAGAAGARLSPADAYRFAMGEQVTSSTGQSVKLSRPLDFLVVADHSDNMGFFPDLFAGDPGVLANPTGRKWYNLINNDQGAEAAWDIIQVFSKGEWPEDLLYMPGKPGFRSAWRPRSRRRTRRMIPAGLRPSSAMNGRHSQVGTTCTAT